MSPRDGVYKQSIAAVLFSVDRISRPHHIVVAHIMLPSFSKMKCIRE